MFAQIDLPLPENLKVFVLIVPVIAQILKQVPIVKAHEDWLVPLFVALLSIGIASVQTNTFALADGLVLAVASMGLYGVSKIPGKLNKKENNVEG